MRVRRGICVAAVISSALLAATCVRSTSRACGDARECADGTTCIAIPQFDAHTCATQGQLDACNGSADGTVCKVNEVPGTCYSGACQPSVCGDGILDTTEVCDDGNREGSDGCSANCLSTELCGDKIVDFARGEECDDGLRGLSGDGCSSTCTTEFPVWRDVSPGLPPQRPGFQVVTGLDGSVAMCGGLQASGSIPATDPPPFRDVWTFDGASWLRVTALGTIPPPRTGFSLARDPSRNRLLLFGGVAADGVTNLDDIWEFDGLRWFDRTPTGTRPAPRHNASLACTTSRCVLFGGATPSTAPAERNDLWSWDGTSWTELIVSGAPTARQQAAWIADQTQNVFELVGGKDRNGLYLVDAWELTATSTWLGRGTVALAAGNAPVGAYDNTNHRAMVLVPLQAWAFDGNTWSFQSSAPASLVGLAYNPIGNGMLAFASAATSNPVFGLDSTTWNARPVLSPNMAGGPNKTTAVYDIARGRTVIVDAATGSSGTEATWEWNGSGFRRVLATPGPPTGDGAALAYDTACKTTLDLTQSQLWSYNGAWTQRNAPPSARTYHAMAFDTDRKTLVVFSGATLDAVTYEWSGACGSQTWKTPTLPTSPPGRSDAAMAYDPVHRVIVLFGGLSGTELGDTWTYDGATWKQATPTRNPPARRGHVMAFDPRSGHVVLFGGVVGGNGRLKDTWAWDAVAGEWNEIPTVLTQSARNGAAMALDVTGALILVGGQQNGGPDNDVSRLRYERGLEPVESCTVATDDLDHDGLAGCADPDCWTRCAPWCQPGTTCTAPHCGDGDCKAPEDYLLCPADCPAP